MNKLFKLKKWLTVPEAARHLSGVFEEPVSEADVLRLCLDGHLTLSCNFVNGALARRGKLIPMAEAFPEIQEQIPLSERIDSGLGFQGVPLNEDFALGLSENNSTLIIGVVDLSMDGAERLDVEHMYQKMTGGADVSGLGHEGIIVINSNGDYCQLQEPPESCMQLIDDYHSPLVSLPEDAVLVVRTDSLRELEKSISDQPAAMLRDESLLAVIAALLSQWPGGKSPSSKDLEKAAQSIGIKISDDTIRKALKAARELAPSLPA